MNLFLSKIEINLELIKLLATAGLFTLIGVILTVIVSSLNSKKERVNKSITEGRIKWINSIRLLFVEFIKSIDDISNKFAEEIFLNKETDKNEFWNIVRVMIYKLKTDFGLIKLHLNFYHDFDNLLIESIDILIKIIEYCNKSSATNKKITYNIVAINDGKKLLFLLFNIYLKVEWERVKIESEKGKVKNKNYNKILDKYKSKKKDEINHLQETLNTEYSNCTKK